LDIIYNNGGKSIHYFLIAGWHLILIYYLNGITKGETVENWN